MAVHARFRLAEDARSAYWSKDGHVDAAHIKLAAVQGEPFGPATPQGTIDMLIVNPDAIKVFRDAKLGQEFDIMISPVKAEKKD